MRYQLKMMSTLEPDWNQIIKDLGPCLYRYFAGSFSTQMASDLVQETLIRLVHKCRNGEFDGDKGDLKSYSYGIARFVRLETIKKGRDFELADDDSSLDVLVGDSKIDKSDAVTHLRWAIGQLKPIEQELMLLMIDDDLTLDQMAESLRMPVGTVKSHIHRAKENLRQLMEVSV